MEFVCVELFCGSDFRIRVGPMALGPEGVGPVAEYECSFRTRAHGVRGPRYIRLGGPRERFLLLRLTDRSELCSFVVF